MITSENGDAQGEDSTLDTLNGYEKLRKVGKGAFGIAVLYRKLCNDSLVVIKQVNMVELTATERQMALNEVQVLKILDHPNVISYYGSFEKNGTLFIEMEYADGGTLAQFLSRQTQPIKEIEILLMFQQIVSALKYMHRFNILHRDLKTANVFLTKEKIIKVGDFGIAKIMTTFAQAHSVLGTPHYISPEMCEGKEYNEKSDIWALGCLLYEMVCLHKTFNGTNLPAVVNKIMKGLFDPVPLDYSSGIRQLIHDLLKKNPQARPTATDILELRIPQILHYLSASESRRQSLEPDCSLSLQSSYNRCGKLERSVLFELLSFESVTWLTPVSLPPKLKIKEIAMSSTHFIALTSEFLVYTWGEGRKGQLGHGDTVPWKGAPQIVDSLKDKNIKTIGAGNGFSVFGSESGMVLTCGDGSFGCLGHGDWNTISRPKLLENLLSVDIITISCGSEHVSALTTDGIMYSWGMGKEGQLGLGHEENCCAPAVVPVPGQMLLKSVVCGGDATMAIAVDGSLLACGRNTHNKLGLTGRKYIFSYSLKEVEKSLMLRRVNTVTAKILDISLGVNHTMILTEDGRIITMGRNLEGQLGRNNTEPSLTPESVKSVAEKVVTMAKSGPTFSIIGTLENEVYFWGTRYKESITPKMLTGDWSNYDEKSIFKVSDKLTSLMNINTSELILEPKEILALYASANQIEKGETITLAGIYVSNNRIFILVETTAPLTKNQDNLYKKGAVEESQYSDIADSLNEIPTWIRKEVERSKTQFVEECSG